jgi:hypothetical protein
MDLEPGPAVAARALFQRRAPEDETLLRLTGLRFAQMGAAAELYADTPDQLESTLRFVPPHPLLPTVHLNRGLNLLHERDRATVAEFARRFAGRVAGLVVHDSREMGDQTGRLVDGLRELDASLDGEGPLVFLEYAAGLEPDWFVETAERVRDVARVSFCVDIGHIGIRQATQEFARRHPGLSLGRLGDQLPALVADVQDAVGSALDVVLGVTRSLGRIGKPVHFHLHDGHPLVPGLSDHFSFLNRFPVSFSYHGRQSLDMLYGLGGLAAIVSTAVAACGPGGVSLTLEVHQAEGRLPLADAAPLFPPGSDLTSAERVNYWLHVLSENVLLLSQAVAGRVPGRAPGPPPEGDAHASRPGPHLADEDSLPPVTRVEPA